MAKHAETRSNLLRFSIHAKNCLKKFTGKTNEAPSARIHCGCHELLLDDCCGIQCPLHPTHRSGMGLPFTPGSLGRCLEGILRFPGNCRSWSSLAEELPDRFKRGSQGQMNVVYIYMCVCIYIRLSKKYKHMASVSMFRCLKLSNCLPDQPIAL